MATSAFEQFIAILTQKGYELEPEDQKNYEEAMKEAKILTTDGKPVTLIETPVKKVMSGWNAYQSYMAKTQKETGVYCLDAIKAGWKAEKEAGRDAQWNEQGGHTGDGKGKCSAYQYFSHITAENKKKNDPTAKTSSTEISKLWKNLTPAEKTTYEQQAKTYVKAK